MMITGTLGNSCQEVCKAFRHIKETYLTQMYKDRSDTDEFIIEISVDNYNEIFNSWDPSPVKRQDRIGS